MKKKIRNSFLAFIACLLVAAQIYVMPKIATPSSKPPLTPEPQATILVFPLPSTLNVQSNLMMMRTLIQENAPQNENAKGLDSTRELKIKN